MALTRGAVHDRIEPARCASGADGCSAWLGGLPQKRSELSAKNDINSGEQEPDLRSGELADPFGQQHLVERDDL